MSVTNGQTANQTTFNNAYMSKTTDDSTIGKKDLSNTDPASGSSIQNAQRELNKLNSFVGSSPNTAYNTSPTWTNNDVGTSGDNLKARAEALTLRFDSTVGHAHTGADGEGAQVSSLNLSSFNKYFSEWQEASFSSAVGTSTVVTTSFSSKTSGGGSSAIGVPTTAPYNQVELRTSPARDQIEEPGGKKVYGRLTESTGVWTLSYYYLNGSGVETSYSLPSQNIVIFFREVFNSSTRPTFGTNSGFIGSQDSTLDVVDASATQRGVVSTGSQSLAGVKTFVDTTQSTDKDTGALILEGGLGVEKNINAGGTVLGSNLSGTNTGDVTLSGVGSSPNANGASISGQTLNLQPASGSFPGVLSTGAQSIAGAKTLTDTTQSTDKDTGALILEGGLGVEKNINAGGSISATGAMSGSNLSGTNTGDMTVSTFGSTPNSSGASVSGQALTLQPADSSNPGGVSTAAQSFSGGKSFVNYLAEQKQDVASAASITALDSTKSFVRLTGTTATTIHGSTAGVNGQMLFVYNNTNTTMTIKHQSGSASSADRFITSDGNDIVVDAQSGIEFIYDMDQSRWVLKSSSGSGGGSFTNPMTTLGDTIYGAAAGAETRLAGNTTTTKKFLAQTGDGTNSAAPVWSQPAFSELSGSVSASQMPGLTGDVTSSGGSVSTTIANSAVTNAKMANMAANTIKGNNTGSSAAPFDLTVAQTAAMFSLPTIQTFTSGSGTYTTPSNCRWIRVRLVGGGGGGGGGGASAGGGSTGGNTTFGTSLLSGSGGNGGGMGSGSGGAGGSASLGSGPIGIAIAGEYGSGGLYDAPAPAQNNGGVGGGSALFGGRGWTSNGGLAGSGVANTGGGGGGGNLQSATAYSGCGGGGGGSVDAIITGPSSSYSYAVGSGGSGGSAGTTGGVGGAGAAGIIIVEEHYI